MKYLCLSHFLSYQFNDHFSWWTWVSQYQNVSILDFTGIKNDGGGGDNCSYDMKRSTQIITINKPTPVFTRQMPFLSPNQQCQSTERKLLNKMIWWL